MLSYSELTGASKFSFLNEASRLTILSSINHEERSAALLKELHDFLVNQNLDLQICHHYVRLAIEADPWLIRGLEEHYRSISLRLLADLEAKGYKVSETEHIISYPDKAEGNFRLLLDRISRNVEDSEVILVDLSVLPRNLLLTAATYIYDSASTNYRLRRAYKFSYIWAKTYFSATGKVPALTLTSHTDSLDLYDYLNPSENVYIFLIANGQGQDTAEVLGLYNEAIKISPLVIDDFVFLFHKTAPHDYIKKARANAHIFSDRRDGDIRYIFSSLQVGSFLSDRTDDLCLRSPKITNLTLLFVPLGPKPCQFAAYFGMREMARNLSNNGCRINSVDIFYPQGEELRTLHSQGVDYCSIMELTEPGK
jgi:hypothetical protein